MTDISAAVMDNGSNYHRKPSAGMSGNAGGTMTYDVGFDVSAGYDKTKASMHLGATESQSGSNSFAYSKSFCRVKGCDGSWSPPKVDSYANTEVTDYWDGTCFRCDTSNAMAAGVIGLWWAHEDYAANNGGSFDVAEETETCCG